uniref:Cell migration inducing hyaluronidase 2 n=1 Tax=Cyprinus carpio TaxID=7962 RepID=A0A8C2PV69_CYPCA
MQVNDGPSSHPIFVAPVNGNAQWSSGYVPGRIVPVRSPPPAKAPPPPPLKPPVPSPARPSVFNLSEDESRRERAQNQQKNTYICVGVFFCVFLLILILVLSLASKDVLDENCPHHNPVLHSWNPGHDLKKVVVVRSGEHYRLDSSATLYSVIIQAGGSVVFADDKKGSKNITLRTRHILIEDGGALHIGAPKCRYRSLATITLVGRSDETAVTEVPGMGRKFLGVNAGGTLELHGSERLSWTFLTRTIPASGLTSDHSFQKNFSRGINLRVVDQDTAEVLSNERFDTHDSYNDSMRLSELLKSLPVGRIVALATGDSAVKNLQKETKRTITDLLGSNHVNNLQYRQAWALVSVIGGGNASCTEEVRDHENHDTGGKALARREFITVDGVGFTVTAYSEWKNGYPTTGFQVDAVDKVVLNLMDDVSSWKPGDRIVVASTDYSMHQAEEFTLLPCPHCNSKQVRIQGEVVVCFLRQEKGENCLPESHKQTVTSDQKPAVITHLQDPDAGIWYVFHNSSTGDSHGLIPETKAELTPLGIFFNNRVHSNFKAGLFIDRKVKSTNATAADPREYLCLDNSARFRPHENSDPSRPRVAALIDTLISFKNNDLGVWIRGGDIIIRNSGFADNGVGLSFASDGSYPKDEGSSQEVSQSLFVGESRNRGTNGGQNKYWGIGGVDGKMRTLPRNKTFPVRGFQINDGPVRILDSTFRAFSPTTERFTMAVGFSLKNIWQLTPRNHLSSLAFQPSVTLRAFFGRPGEWFEQNDLDGDKNSIFHDLDGSISNYKDTYVARADNFLIRHPQCVDVPHWNGVVCSGKYSQVYIQTQGASNLSLSISRDEYPDKPMVLRGIRSQTAPSQQYQPVLMMGKSYTVHWNGPAPRETVLSLINFDQGDWALLGFCYPNETVIQITSDIYNKQSNSFDGIEDYGPVSSISDLEKRQQERKYFFDKSVGLLWLYARAWHRRDGHSYCSTAGCERVKIIATMHANQKTQTCNCTANAYPKYKKPASNIVPMPKPNTEPCRACGATQVRTVQAPYERTESFVYLCLSGTGFELCVNAKRFDLKRSGFLIVTVDACSGKVTKNSLFTMLDTKMEQYFKTGIIKRSIVLLATRGQPAGIAGAAQYLVPLGSAKTADLQKKGSSPQPWSALLACQDTKVLGLQERFIPLSLKEYSCPPQKDHPTRMDIELLRKSLSQK